MSQPTKAKYFPTLAFCVIIGIAATLPRPVPAESSRRSAIVEAIAKAKPAIVSLRTLRVIPARFDNVESGRVRGLGTGVIFDPRGYVVTNYHVVEDVNEIEARTADGKRFSASTVAIDKRADLAILKIDTDRRFKYLSLDGAGGPILGETVVAIGNPYGLEDSVTIGIISAVDRELKLPNGEMFSGLIQTDASINPGNSGGPLLTVEGDLLAINVAIRSNAQGIAFAIPAGRVHEILTEMMRGARSVRHQGIQVEDNAIVQAVAVENARPGVFRVRAIEPGSPAEQAGVQPGDEVLEIDGQPVQLRFDLDRVFWDRKAGERLPIVIRREGQKQPFELVVGGAPSDEDLVWRQLGIQVRPVMEPVRRVQPKWEGGLFIARVRTDSPADRAGFKPGDILCGLDGNMMLQPSHVRYVLKLSDLAERQPVRYHLIRESRIVEGRIHLPQSP